MYSGYACLMRSALLKMFTRRRFSLPWDSARCLIVEVQPLPPIDTTNASYSAPSFNRPLFTLHDRINKRKSLLNMKNGQTLIHKMKSIEFEVTRFKIK